MSATSSAATHGRPAVAGWLCKCARAFPWRFRDGLVERYRADHDSSGALRRLGLVPQPGSRGWWAIVALQRTGTRLRR